MPVNDPTNSEENIIHYNSIRPRVVGTGNLRPTFYDLSQTVSSVLVPIPMNNSGRQILRLANFQSQRAFLKFETLVIDEVFNVNRVVVFTKLLFTMYPA